MADFLTALEWWKLNPDDSRVTNGDYGLADPGRTYVVYWPQGGAAQVKLEPGNYRASWFNPRSGETTPLPAVSAGWTSPTAPGDWVLLIRKE